MPPGAHDDRSPGRLWRRNAGCSHHLPRGRERRNCGFRDLCAWFDRSALVCRIRRRRHCRLCRGNLVDGQRRGQSTYCRHGIAERAQDQQDQRDNAAQSRQHEPPYLPAARPPTARTRCSRADIRRLADAAAICAQQPQDRNQQSASKPSSDQPPQHQWISFATQGRARARSARATHLRRHNQAP